MTRLATTGFQHGEVAARIGAAMAAFVYPRLCAFIERMARPL